LNKRHRSGAFVIFYRGKITFARKVINAIQAGACGVIICQTYDVWPFVMTDSTNELQNIDIRIPVLMISKADSELIERLLLNTSESHHIGKCHIQRLQEILKRAGDD
jgi:hypothetical protein